MNSIPAKVQLTELNRRINNGGQEEGPQSVYLWVIMFAIDGTNIYQDGFSLMGSPQWFFGSGSDWNLNQEISQGQGIPIPAPVGTWPLLGLKPILITDSSTQPPTFFNVPATIAVIAVLMDSAAPLTEYMEVGHQALNNFVQNQINNFISGINLLTVSQNAQKLVMQGQSGEAATVATIQNLLAPVIKSIQSGASSVGYNAVKNAVTNAGVAWEILAGLWPDAQIGNQYLTISQDQLMNLDPLGQTNYTSYQFNLVCPTPNDDYYIYGFAVNLNRFASVSPGVPPGSWQVTGVNKGFSSSLRSSYIKEIGGQLSDGSQWYLERSAAVALIKSGVNSFYVEGADGSRASVIVSDKPIEGETNLDYYLTTTPDRSVEDNLNSLPPFSLTQLVPGPPTP